MIRKNIDLPEDVIKKLRILAAYDGVDVKNYMQDVLETHAKQVYEWVFAKRGKEIEKLKKK